MTNQRNIVTALVVGLLLSAACEQTLRTGKVGNTVSSEQVWIDVAVTGIQPIHSAFIGVLEFLGRLLHPLFELPLEDVGLSFQEKHHFLDHLHVVFP